MHFLIIKEFKTWPEETPHWSSNFFSNFSFELKSRETTTVSRGCPELKNNFSKNIFHNHKNIHFKIFLYAFSEIFLRSLWGSVQPPKVVPIVLTHPIVGFKKNSFKLLDGVGKYFQRWIFYVGSGNYSQRWIPKLETFLNNFEHSCIPK